MKTPAENYQKALLELVGTLDALVARPVSAGDFYARYGVGRAFFNALRDLDCIHLDLTRSSNESYYTCSAALYKITAAEVMEAEKPAKKAERPGGRVNADKKPTITMESTMLQRALATGETPPEATVGQHKKSVIDSGEMDSTPPKQAEIVAVSDTKGSPIEVWNAENPTRFPFAKAPEPAKETQRGYKDDCGDLSCGEFGCVNKIADAWREDAALPQTEPKPYPNLSATVPMLDSHKEAAAYCADVIFAHANNEPHDVTGLLASVIGVLKAQMAQRAQELREEAAAILSRADAFDAAANLTF